MDDEEYECPLWWQTQTPVKEFHARIEATKERVEKEDHARDERSELWRQRHEEFKDIPNGRNWAIWREYKAGGTTLEKVGKNFGITRERVRGIVAKIDRGMRTVLNRGVATMWSNVPDEYREGTLGVEFVFSNELVFDNCDERRGWEKVDPYGRGRRYFPPTPEWRTDLPFPVHTYYKTIVKKEQTDEN